MTSQRSFNEMEEMIEDQIEQLYVDEEGSVSKSTDEHDEKPSAKRQWRSLFPDMPESEQEMMEKDFGSLYDSLLSCAKAGLDDLCSSIIVLKKDQEDVPDDRVKRKSVSYETVMCSNGKEENISLKNKCDKIVHNMEKLRDSTLSEINSLLDFKNTVYRRSLESNRAKNHEKLLDTRTALKLYRKQYELESVANMKDRDRQMYNELERQYKETINGLEEDLNQYVASVNLKTQRNVFLNQELAELKNAHVKLESKCERIYEDLSNSYKRCENAEKNERVTKRKLFELQRKHAALQRANMRHQQKGSKKRLSRSHSMLRSSTNGSGKNLTDNGGDREGDVDGIVDCDDIEGKNCPNCAVLLEQLESYKQSTRFNSFIRSDSDHSESNAPVSRTASFSGYESESFVLVEDTTKDLATVVEKSGSLATASVTDNDNTAKSERNTLIAKESMDNEKRPEAVHRDEEQNNEVVETGGPSNNETPGPVLSESSKSFKPTKNDTTENNGVVFYDNSVDITSKMGNVEDPPEKADVNENKNDDSRPNSSRCDPPDNSERLAANLVHETASSFVDAVTSEARRDSSWQSLSSLEADEIDSQQMVRDFDERNLSVPTSNESAPEAKLRTGSPKRIKSETKTNMLPDIIGSKEKQESNRSVPCVTTKDRENRSKHKEEKKAMLRMGFEEVEPVQSSRSVYVASAAPQESVCSASLEDMSARMNSLLHSSSVSSTKDTSKLQDEEPSAMANLLSDALSDQRRLEDEISNLRKDKQDQDKYISELTGYVKTQDHIYNLKLKERELLLRELTQQTYDLRSQVKRDKKMFDEMREHADNNLPKIGIQKIKARKLASLARKEELHFAKLDLNASADIRPATSCGLRASTSTTRMPSMHIIDRPTSSPSFNMTNSIHEYCGGAMQSRPSQFESIGVNSRKVEQAWKDDYNTDRMSGFMVFDGDHSAVRREVEEVRKQIALLLSHQDIALKRLRAKADFTHF